MRKGLIGVFSIVGATLLNGAAWGQCEVTQLASQGGFGPVSIDGDVAVVADMDAFGLLGAAYVYHRGPGGPEDWTIAAVLMAPEPDPMDGFGFSLTLSDDVILVGALIASAPDVQNGAAYVFRYDPDSAKWEYETTLIASDHDGTDTFGFSVSIDGDVILIGARDDENDGVCQSGSAYVFRYDGRDWIEEAKLTDPNGEERDLFGVSVSIKGDAALIGAHGNDGLHGAAFVFRYDAQEPQKWFLETELDPSDDMGQDWFGFSLSLADGVAIVSAFQDNSTDKGNDAGSAYIFRYDPDTSGWIEEQNLTASDADPLDWFGWSVSISEDGNTVLVGAPEDEEQGFASGSAYVFHYENGVWRETVKLLASDGAAGDYFGGSLSLDDGTAVIKGGGKGYIFAGMSGLDCNDNGEPDACDILGGQSNDQNNNGVPDECDADLDDSGSVGASDLLILLVNWGPCENCDDCPADLDGNCTVGASDLLILLVNWG